MPKLFPRDIKMHPRSEATSERQEKRCFALPRPEVALWRKDASSVVPSKVRAERVCLASCDYSLDRAGLGR